MSQATELRPELVKVIDGAAAVYNQAAFHYFVAHELKRSVRSARRLMLVLVRLRRRDGQHQRLSPGHAAQVFLALQTCVREVDLVGWHREGVVAAALLTISSAATFTAKRMVRDRVVAELDQRLATQDTARLHVRAVELRRCRGDK